MTSVKKLIFQTFDFEGCECNIYHSHPSVELHGRKEMVYLKTHSKH